MTVYVDELRVWPHAKHRCFRAGSAHLTADSLEELHAFAKSLGLRRAWFQEHRLAPHYDLSPKRHIAALNRGAMFVPAKEQVRRRMAATSHSSEAAAPPMPVGRAPAAMPVVPGAVASGEREREAERSR